jgi:predicted transposase/invertase (TIGR01784 family)
MAPSHHPHDAFFKQLFTRPEVAEDFVRHYLPKEVVALLETGTLTITKDSFIDEALAEHYSDLLYRVQLKAGNEAYVYLLFEHKSAPAPRVALDLLRYLVRIWDFLGKRGNKTPLPAILPLVIYHGKARWRIAHSFSHLIDAPEALRPYLPEFTYLLTDLSHLRDEEIQGEVILRMGLWILKYIFRGELPKQLPELMALLPGLVRRSGGLEFLEIMLRYLSTAAPQLEEDDLRRAVVQALPEGERIMASIAEKWVQQGLEQGERQVLLRLVRRRFGEATAQQSEILLVRITELTQLEDLGEALLECEDGAAWLHRLQAAVQGSS